MSALHRRCRRATLLGGIVFLAPLRPASAQGTDGLPPLDRPAINEALERAYDDVQGALALQERILRVLEDVLVRILRFVFGQDGALGTLLAVLAGVLVVWGLVLLARRLGLVRDPHLDATASASTRPVDWLAEAEAALARGDLEHALRAHWQHLLHVLDERGLVHEAPSLTPAETRSEVAVSAPALADAVGRASAAVERVVYAEELPTRAHLDHVTTATERAAER